MKRSEVNKIIGEAKDFFRERKFLLPLWAEWGPGDWKGAYGTCSEIIDNKLGWDITDFGSEDFVHTGLTLFTIRNGNWDKQDKTYCEKIMIAGEDQVTPTHFHWNKSEDIINRGGGDLVMELWLAGDDDEPLDLPVQVQVDGVKTNVQPGEKLILVPGQSICLKPRVYHRFYGLEGKGMVMIGEVSAVNDDEHDNRFYEEIGRFPAIEEDVEPLHLLVSDYERYI
jgi:D-lyxose ketol-isomerase